MRRLLSAALVLALWPAVATAGPIVYNVNRIVGAGSVVGSITTDGTLGVLASSNILSWSLTLTSANLSGGSPQAISSASPSGAAGVFGTLLSASASSMFFDFGGGSTGYLLLQAGAPNFNYWCVQTNQCHDFSGPSEAIGFTAAGGNAERVVYTSVEIIATSATTAVPEPASLLLVATGFALATVRIRSRRRR